MRASNGLLAVAAGAVVLVLFVADLIVPESGVSSMLTQALGVSSIGIAIWTITLIAR